MSRGELLTRITVWIAIAGYALGVAFSSGKDSPLFRDGVQWQARARLAWTVGCVGLIAHTICAFHFHHHWSQASAIRETARQTAALTGMNWGGGLFINYAFLAAWAADVAWWWRGLNVYRRRPWPITAIWHGVFLFMIFNATVVFKTGVVRWVGLGLCLGVLWVWLIAARRKSLTTP